MAPRAASRTSTACPRSRATRASRPSRRSSSRSTPTTARARTRPRPAARCAAAARSPGARRAPAAPAPAPAARPSGRGGGVVFGPKPRDYYKKINGKVKALAFSRALFDRASAGEIAVIENFGLSRREDQGRRQGRRPASPRRARSCWSTPRSPPTTRLAARNLERVSLQEAAKLNTLDLAQYRKIIVSTKALETIIARVNGGKN